MNFTHSQNRIFLLNDNNKTIAEVTFPDIDENTVNINHTYVADSLRGQGVAGKLMKAAAEQLQAQNKKAILTCSFAVKWFERNPEYSDLLK
ncbi:MAG: GNAT family N-acetyltransferase [Clostridia bacterium]|nr:GNAT family N-acetyltransferase [Clostridia bacterium]